MLDTQLPLWRHLLFTFSKRTITTLIVALQVESIQSSNEAPPSTASTPSTNMSSTNSTRPTDRPGYKDGGLDQISDSLFSLIILLYVAVAFVFVYFLFCWKRGTTPSDKDPNNPNHCPLIVLESMEADNGEAAKPLVSADPPGGEHAAETLACAPIYKNPTQVLLK